jgi:hypothetical protein
VSDGQVAVRDDNTSTYYHSCGAEARYVSYDRGAASSAPASTPQNSSQDWPFAGYRDGQNRYNDPIKAAASTEKMSARELAERYVYQFVHSSVPVGLVKYKKGTEHWRVRRTLETMLHQWAAYCGAALSVTVPKNSDCTEWEQVSPQEAAHRVAEQCRYIAELKAEIAELKSKALPVAGQELKLTVAIPCPCCKFPECGHKHEMTGALQKAHEEYYAAQDMKRELSALREKLSVPKSVLDACRVCQTNSWERWRSRDAECSRVKRSMGDMPDVRSPREAGPSIAAI